MAKAFAGVSLLHLCISGATLYLGSVSDPDEGEQSFAVWLKLLEGNELLPNEVNAREDGDRGCTFGK